ncbi:MAG: O-antigen ligase family protein [Acidobacteria bacterium]|nr:O-antigen ligase family protein [Acidobacteriota bacterium]
MGVEGNRLLFIILACLVFLAPFGEGGAAPLAQLTLQLLVLSGGAVALLLPSSGVPWKGATRGVLIAAVGFMAVAFLSCLHSPYPYASFLRILDWLLPLGVVAIALRRRWEEWEKSLLADVVLAAAALQAGVVLFGMLRGTSASILKSFGLLNTNHEAAYLLAAVLLTFPRLDFRNLRRASTARSVALLLCLVAFTLLRSRGALLGLLAGVSVLLAFRWKSLSPRKRLVTALGVGLVVAAGAVALVSRFGAVEDPYRYQRLGIWGADLRCFAGHPLLGVGAGVFRHAADRFNFPLEGPVRFGRSFETPHSDYLGLLAEMGLLGLTAGLVLLIRSLQFLAGLRRQQDRIAEGLLAGGAALAVQGLVEDLSIRPALLVTMASLLGACLAGVGLGKSASVQRGPHFFKTRALAILGLALFGWIALRNPYLAFVKDQAMRRSSTYRDMEQNFRAAIRLNPYQASTYLLPTTAFLAARPEVPLSLDWYARFRRDLDEGIRMDRISAGLQVALARLEARAFRSIFHDAAARDRVIGAYRAAIRMAPHDPRIRVELAGFLHEVGRRNESARQIRMALREEPNYLTARLLATRLLLEEGRREEALTSWGAARKSRSILATYRPDSAYASDIARDPAPLRASLERDLGPL